MATGLNAMSVITTKHSSAILFKVCNKCNKSICSKNLLLMRNELEIETENIHNLDAPEKSLLESVMPPVLHYYRSVVWAFSLENIRSSYNADNQSTI